MASSASIITDLRTAYDWWKSLPPILTAIWFVDRPREYYAFRARHGYPEQRDAFAVRIEEWYAWAVESDEEWRRAPAFCRTPGVWFRMSDGSARSLADDAIAGLLDGTIDLYTPRETAAP